MSAHPILRNARVGAQRHRLGAPGASPAPALQPAAAASHAVSDEAQARGFEAGHAEGLRQGLAEAQSRIERELESRWTSARSELEKAQRLHLEQHAQRISALEHLLQALQTSLPERFASLERQAVELSFEALCKVCGPGTDRSELLADLVRQGIAQLRSQALLSVRLHPEDQQALAASEAGRRLMERHAELRFVADPAVEPAGCLLETDAGQLDAGLGRQLGRLRELWSQAGAASPRGAE